MAAAIRQTPQSFIYLAACSVWFSSFERRTSMGSHVDLMQWYDSVWLFYAYCCPLHFFAIFILFFRHSTQVVMLMIVSSKLHLPFHRPIGPERQKKRKRWCMVIILWHMCRVTDFTKCELALLRLPAPGLRGTWARTYALLTRLVSQIGWDEIFKDVEPYFCHGRLGGVSHAENTKRHSESVVSYFDQWISTLARFWYWNCRDTWWNSNKSRAKHFAESYLTTGVNRRRETSQLQPSQQS